MPGRGCLCPFCVHIVGGGDTDGAGEAAGGPPGRRRWRRGPAVVLPAFTVKALREHRVRQAGERLKLGTEYEANGFDYPSARDRIRSLRGLTLIHGDAHPGNLLYPLDPERDALYMVDWQAYRVRTGVVDVAYMFIFHWYPERRYAMPFLEHYYRSLLANGVTDYDWDTFWLDLQVAVVDYLMDAPRLAEAKVPAHVWWPIYQRGLTAYHEFGCEAVFEL